MRQGGVGASAAMIYQTGVHAEIIGVRLKTCIVRFCGTITMLPALANMASWTMKHFAGGLFGFEV